ncbi:MAG: M48 family metallopeptidase [Janthinobacterium lividum]
MRLIFLAACLALIFLPLTARAAPNSPAPAATIQSTDVRPPVVTPQMKRYSETGYVLYFVGTVYELLLLWGVLASGLSARLRRLVQPLRFSLLRLLGYYVLLTLVLLLAHAPLTFYGGYYIEHAYGLSSESFGGWLGDLLKGVGVDILTAVPILWLLFWLINRSPRRWALWFWGALIPIIAFGIFAAPLVVDPLFNKFTPLTPGPLRTQIEALASKAGIPDAPIYVVDKSRQTHETNAYVTGIGSSARIVLWDTILPPRMPQDQVVAIVGHEMGHYVLKHLYWGFLMSVLGLLLVLPLAQKFAERLLHRFGPGWQIDSLTDYAATPVLLLTVSLFGFLLAPITNGISREIEHQADAYGLQVTQNPPAMARAFVSLSEQNLSAPNPPPFIKFWLFTHPPLQERIDFVLGRKSANKGE